MSLLSRYCPDGLTQRTGTLSFPIKVMGAVGRAVGAALAPSQWPIYTNISPKLRTVSAIVKGSERTITRSLLPRPISPFNWDLIDASGDILVLSMDGSMLADDNKLVLAMMCVFNFDTSVASLSTTQQPSHNDERHHHPIHSRHWNARPPL